MKKIINPCKCKIYSYNGNVKMYDAFCEINFDETNGRLSIHGVVAPMKDGNCLGSAGQCIDEIRKGTPTKNWTEDMLNEFCNVWEKWHLNDMQPYCEHQKALGWDIIASKKVTLYHYKLKPSVLRLQKDAERAALSALKNGETFTPTKQQSLYASLSYFNDTYTDVASEYYEPYKNISSGFSEIKCLGWLTEKEHPEGILCKPCPVCGYKYGTAWIKKDVPTEVLAFLKSIPETEIIPAWI